MSTNEPSTPDKETLASPVVLTQASPAPGETAQASPAPCETAQTSPAPDEAAEASPTPDETAQASPAPDETPQAGPAPDEEVQAGPAPNMKTPAGPSSNKKTPASPASNKKTQAGPASNKKARASSAPGKKTQAGPATSTVSLPQPIKSINLPSIPKPCNQPARRPMEMMLKYCPRLNNMNWVAWSTAMISNFNIIGVLYLFRGLEEEAFQNAIIPELTPQEKERDEADCRRLICAGLDGKALSLVANAPTVKICWMILRDRYVLSPHLQHVANMDDIMHEMRWRDGDKMFSKWLNIQGKFGALPEYEFLLDGTTTMCIRTRLIFHLWAKQLPHHIAAILERHLRHTQGNWLNIMLDIDNELEFNHPSQPNPAVHPATIWPPPDRRHQRLRVQCQFCKRHGHYEQECRIRRSFA